MKRTVHLFSKKNRKDTVFFAGGVFLAVLAGFLFLNAVGFSNINAYFTKPGNSVKGAILFYGNDCQQCTTVDTFIATNKVSDKFPFTRLEVFGTSANADLLKQKAMLCGLDVSQIGVPFLWDGAACHLGYVDVINFLKQKTAKKP